MKHLNIENFEQTIKENKTILNISPENFLIKCDIMDSYEELLELI